MPKIFQYLATKSDRKLLEYHWRYCNGISSKDKRYFLVQLHVTKDEYDKDGDKYCVVYDGVLVRDNFQYAKVKLVEESDRNDPLNAREVFSSFFKGQITQITNIYDMNSL